MSESKKLHSKLNGGTVLASKKTTLRPLIESNVGTHLSTYLVNREDLIDLKAQLKQVIGQAHKTLSLVMSLKERNKFLEPLESLILDARVFKKMKGNIGIFRNQDSFVILNIPIEVEQFFQVASSFHIKPLLKWLQIDQDFLLLGFKNDSAQLYLGSQDSFRLIDSIFFPDFFKKKESLENQFSQKEMRELKFKEDETFKWIDEWVTKLTKNTRPKLFIAGEKSLLKSLNRNFKYENQVKTPIAHSFGDHNLLDICFSIRKILKAESKNDIQKTLSEFRLAEEGNRSCNNIFQISKAVVEGRVRKLLITDEMNVFGKIDKNSGRISIHPFDLDHEDDDILDDLAQMVLSQGGEVTIASREEIPKARPIMAILENEEKNLEKIQVLELYNERKQRYL